MQNSANINESLRKSKTLELEINHRVRIGVGVGVKIIFESKLSSGKNKKFQQLYEAYFTEILLFKRWNKNNATINKKLTCKQVNRSTSSPKRLEDKGVPLISLVQPSPVIVIIC